MNIVHFTGYKKQNANGVDVIVAKLAKEQKKLGHKISFWTIDKSKNEISIEIVDGFEIVKFPEHKLALKNFILNKSIKEYLSDIKIDIFHLHSVYLPRNISIAILLNKLNIPYIVTPHGGYDINSRKKSIISNIKKSIFDILYEKKFLNRAKGIQALTEQEKKDIQRLSKNDNIFIIPNGIEDNLNYVQSQCKEFKIDSDYIVYCGRLDIQHKGIDILINSFILYKKIYKSDLKLVIIGPNNKEVENIIRKSKFIDDIILTGTLYGEEKNYVIQNSNFFIHTPRWEAFGMTIIEAMQLGKTVLITENCDIANTISQYNYGIVSKLEPKEIARNIDILYRKSGKDDFLREQLHLSKLIISECYNIKKITYDICEKYIEVI